jgi:hypothetical protein
MPVPSPQTGQGASVDRQVPLRLSDAPSVSDLGCIVCSSACVSGGILRLDGSTINHMRRREVAFLLIGLGVGLIFAVAAIVWFALWFHHMFIIGIRLNPASIVLTLPFLLVLIGSMLLYPRKRESP